MKKISAILFFLVSLLFSSASMAQSSDFWVGQWDLTYTDPADTERLFSPGILRINLEDDNLVGELVSLGQYGSEIDSFVIDHFNDSDTELILGIKVDEWYITLTLLIEDDETLSGTTTGYGEGFVNVIAERRVSDDSSTDMPQISNPWVGQFNLDFKNIDDEETSFAATLNVDYVNGKLEGYIIYFYQDDTREEVVIEHFNDSDTDLILGFKVEGSDNLFFPLTLRFEDSGSISGSWEDEEESYTIEGFRILGG